VSEPTLRVCALYPDLMNIYADRGNLLLLQRRCDWRGIGFELSSSGVGDELDPDSADLFYIGGGQDRDQELCAHDLAELKRASLHRVADRGAVIFAVCGGYQLLGHSYELGERTLPGAGIVDLLTVREDGLRLIGNAAIEVTLTAGKRQTIAGFENHAGRTVLGPGARPLGRILRGNGNNGRDGNEGVLGGPRSNVIGTYLHGPLLPKNAWLADWLIAHALRLTKPLAGLHDELEQAAHGEARRAAGV
jgi:lipid II isoglutaminyl synthase (glutamine-hydrolysing)